MEKAAFTETDADPKWWLLELELDYALAELRKDLSEHIGWGRDYQWYIEKWKVEELYNLIEQRDAGLLRDVDEATDDYRRQEWITRVVALTKPAPEDAAAGQAAHSGTEAVPVPASASDPAPAKASPFKKKVKEEEAPAPPASEVHEQLHTAVQGVMTHLEPENLSGLAAELGATEEELAELIKELSADFEKLVAAEAAKLTGATR